MSWVERQSARAASALTDNEWDFHLIHPVLGQNASLSENAFHKAAGEITASKMLSHWPLWLKPTLDQLNTILQLPEGWDSYGAAPIAFENAEYAVRLLDFIMTAATPAAFIAPTSKGSLQLEWHRSGIDLEVEILSPYRLSVSYEDHSGATRPWEGEVTTDLTKLREAIEELSRRA